MKFLTVIEKMKWDNESSIAIELAASNELYLIDSKNTITNTLKQNEVKTKLFVYILYFTHKQIVCCVFFCKEECLSSFKQIKD